MGTHRTAWHVFFAALLRKRGPRWIEVRDEVPLSDEPPRLDYLLLRRIPEVPADDPGQTLRGLWPLLPPTTIAELDVVANAEGDDMLSLFSHRPRASLDARRFWAELTGTKEAMMAVQEMEDFEELERRFLDQVPPEKRVAGLAPEQRLAGLAPEDVVRAVGTDQLLQAMPDEVLRALSDAFIEKLPEPTRSIVRKRLGR